jgi:ferritin
MISEKMQKELNDQINMEMFSSYLYLSMAAHFMGENLGGVAQWMYVQSTEETGHAMKILKYIDQQNGRIELAAIAKPQGTWDTPLAAFKDALAHEQKVTQAIAGLVETARAEKDYATGNFLAWFVTEQVEEEASARDVVEKLEMIKNAPGGLFMIDAELGKRKID